MDGNYIMSIAAVVLSVSGTVYAALNHTKVRSACCGRRIEVSLDIDKTTPPPIKAPSDN
jgi:hypothetical protein